MSITLFVEGGGNRDMDNRCRAGFRGFLDKLDMPHGRPRIVACGPRAAAYDRFKTAMTSDPSGSYLLLVDSEEVLRPEVGPWQHVLRRPGDGWTAPSGTADDHLHFMAVCMESWLVADAKSLAKFYGAGFREKPLPVALDLESVGTDDVLSALRSATAETKKGAYAKGKTSYAALGAIDVDTVRNRMPHCERFVRRLVSSRPE